MGEISYQGESPFRVMTAQPTTARGSGRAVVMTVFASEHGRHPADIQIEIPMSPDEAQRLAADLQAAVAEANKWKGGR